MAVATPECESSTLPRAGVQCDPCVPSFNLDCAHCAAVNLEPNGTILHLLGQRIELKSEWLRQYHQPTS